MVYQYLADVVKEKGAAFLTLLDPADKITENLVKSVCENGADAILVGGSTMGNTDFSNAVKQVKDNSSIPVILFPGGSMQVSGHADAILFLSLLSGRNPEYLIGEQVKATPVIKELGLEVIPTGYLLIESGSLTSVLFVSNTLPIPRNKVEIARAHALTAEYMGMKFAYLDAGSGADESVPAEMINAIKNYINIPMIIGGGIRTPEDAKAKVEAGASCVVVGNLLQKNPELGKQFAEAIHKKGEK